MNEIGWKSIIRSFSTTLRDENLENEKEILLYNVEFKK